MGQACKVKKEISTATRILSMIHAGEQVWAACQDRKIRVWSTKSLELEAEFDSIHEDNVNNLCYVPSAQQVWSSSDDCAIHVWDLKVLLLSFFFLHFVRKEKTRILTYDSIKDKRING